MNQKSHQKYRVLLILGAVQAWQFLPNMAHAEKNTMKSPIADNPYAQSVVAGDVLKPPKNILPDCHGLDREYWVDWRNHYTKYQFRRLLKNSIASNIQEADQILGAKGDLFGDSFIDYLYAAVLINQLTMNLSSRPGLPNPTKAELKRSCRLESGCEPGQRARFVKGCGTVDFDFQCDLGYWVDLGQKISREHQKSGCGRSAELFECSDMAFEANYLDDEIEVASCVLERFANREIDYWDSLPLNPY